MLKSDYLVLLVAVSLHLAAAQLKGIQSPVKSSGGSFQQQLLAKKSQVSTGVPRPTSFNPFQSSRPQPVLIAATQEKAADNTFPSKFQKPLLFSSFPSPKQQNQNRASKNIPGGGLKAQPIPFQQQQIPFQQQKQLFDEENPTVGIKVQQTEAPISAAVITKRTHEVIDLNTDIDEITPQVIIVEPSMHPVTIEFRSRSSPVNINQVHIPTPTGEEKITRSQEEPDRVIHEVVKPVIQEVREIIQPYRRITQQILPVQEEVHSIITRGQRKQVVKEKIGQQLEQEPEPIIQQQEIKIEELALKRAPLSPSPSKVPSPAPQFPSFQNTGTIVRAGLIGGTRIMPQGQVLQQVEEELASLIPSINNRGSLKNKA